MTERDDELSRRYRALARDEPPAAMDAAILAKARQGASTPGEGASGTPRGMARWMGPVSIAAVLVLGIGVSLRMQLEEPGVETSHPTSSPEYPMPSAEPAPVEAPAPPQPTPPPGPLAKRLEAEPAPKPTEPNPFADAPLAMQQAPVPASPATTLAATAPPPAARAERAAAEEAPRAAPPPTAGAPQSAPQRAKRLGVAADNATSESRTIANVADPDPARELERIARLREAGRHGDADRALEEFPRRHPGFRIPEAMWERVKPR